MSKLVVRSFGSLVWGIIGLACTSGSPGGAGKVPDGPDAPAPVPDAAAYACQTTEDCVVVETACCDHCNGGKAEAFNKAEADKYRPKDCGETQCTAMGCGEAVATCVANKCEAQIKEIVPPG